MNTLIRQRIEQIKAGQVPDGYQLTDVGSITMDWNRTKARDVFESISDRSHNGQLQVLSATQDRGIVPRSEFDIDIKFDETSLPNYKKVVPGNFVIHLRSFQGGLAYSDVEGIISPAYTILKSKIQINDYFYKSLFQSKNYIRRLNAAVYGIRDGKQISYENFGEIVIPAPPLKEQQKIAEILGEWDKAIAIQEQLVVKLEERARAVLQYFFRNSSSWKEYRLNEIGTFYNGISGKTKDDFGYGKKYIPYKNIYLNSIINADFLELCNINGDERITQVKYGDIFFTTSSENPEEVGMSSVLLDEIDDTYLNSFCFGFRLNNFELLSPEFASWLFRSPDFRKKLIILAQGPIRFNISKKEVGKLRVCLPTILDQKVITSILSSFSNVLRIEKQKLERLKLQKKALMQLLLTGIVRVKV